MPIDTPTTAQQDGDEQLVVFTLDHESYGVSIEAVNTIIRLPDITFVPKAPAFVKGVINLRGVIVPIISLRTRFGMHDSTVTTKATRVIVVEYGGMLVGMIVDAVTETLHMPAANIEPLSNIVVSADARFLRRVGKLGDRLIILMDLAKIFERDEVEKMNVMLNADVMH